MISMDGSYLEGGGQIIRTSIGLSAVTGKPVKISNIRANRPKPGLQTQHLEGVKAAAELCNAKTRGLEFGSSEIEFHPGDIASRDLSVNIKTAGSIGLVFQSIKLLALKLKKEIEIQINGGATWGKWAPPLMYTKSVLLPTLARLGYKADIDIQKHGFYPAGGARVRILLYPCKKIYPIILENTGKITHLGGISIASNHLQKVKVAERQAKSAESKLRSFSPMVKEMYVNSDNPGSGILLYASDGKNIVGSSSLGERGKSSEDVGKQASNSLLYTINSKASCDINLADQCLPFLAIAKGESRITVPEISDHAKTNIWVIEKFLPVKFDIEKTKPITITVQPE